MRIAFYAPLKPPDHPVPSGDRAIARLLLQALQYAGHDAFVAASLRSYDGAGDERRQRRIAAIGTRLADRLIRRWRRHPEVAPDAWFTYHLYHKAPDWLGPRVGAALGIPYIVAEASHAGKRAGGCWALGHNAVADAIRQADAILGLNSTDREGVGRLLDTGNRWVPLRPFLDAGAYTMSRHLPGERVTRLVTLAMMRDGDKLASYRVLGAALASLRDLPWSIEIIGDGPARPDVEAALAPLGERVRYTGALPPEAIAARLADSDLYIWPAINEAFGMALLEAQACSLPVIAGESGGVADIVEPGSTGLLTPPGDVGAFADAVRRLLSDADLRARMSASARARVLKFHDIAGAADRLRLLLANLSHARAA